MVSVCFELIHVTKDMEGNFCCELATKGHSVHAVGKSGEGMGVASRPFMLCASKQTRVSRLILLKSKMTTKQNRDWKYRIILWHHCSTTLSVVLQPSCSGISFPNPLHLM